MTKSRTESDRAEDTRGASCHDSNFVEQDEIEKPLFQLK